MAAPSLPELRDSWFEDVKRWQVPSREVWWGWAWLAFAVSCSGGRDRRVCHTYDARAIWLEFFPQAGPTGFKKSWLRTSVLWFLGIYAAFFAMTSARAESSLDRIESRTGGIYVQSATKSKAAIARIDGAQAMTRPLKPGMRRPDLVLASSSVRERDEETVENLKALVAGENDSLSEVDLRWAGLSIRGIELRGANLRGANLGGTDLRGADLRGADLNGADLRGAELDWADLSRAELRAANLSDAKLRGANLRGANLGGADLNGADLTGADLRGADFRGAELHGGNFSDANLSDANLSRANLSKANLSEVDLRGADLNGADLDGAELDWADLREAIFKRANLRRTRHLTCDQLRTARSWEFAYRDEGFACGAPVPEPSKEVE